jgi:hypothetical protein
MRKLKLESLQVESFETTTNAHAVRGTVQGQGIAGPQTPACPPTGASYCAICQQSVDIACDPDTYDVAACGPTRYHHCSYGCTQYATCRVDECVIATQPCGVID